jgi:hypothetical protein
MPGRARPTGTTPIGAAHTQATSPVDIAKKHHAFS